MPNEKFVTVGWQCDDAAKDATACKRIFVPTLGTVTRILRPSFPPFPPLHLLPLKVIQDLCTTYCPLDVASAQWNLLLRFRAGNASSTRILAILRYLWVSVSTRTFAPLNIYFRIHDGPVSILDVLSSFFLCRIRFKFEIIRGKGKKRKRIFREFFQNEFLLLEILRFPVKNLKEFGKILAIHPSVD